jgi:hypothetical protein
VSCVAISGHRGVICGTEPSWIHRFPGEIRRVIGFELEKLGYFGFVVAVFNADNGHDRSYTRRDEPWMQIQLPLGCAR